MLDTNHKRKGLVGTIVIHSVLFVLFLFVGMGYNDPPPEPGIAIVFGYDDAGKDGFNPPPKPKPVVEEIEEVEEEIVEEEVVEETPVEEPVSEPEPVEEEVEKTEEEALMTQESEEADIAAAEKEAEKLKKEKADILEKERLETEKKESDRLAKIEVDKIAADKIKEEKRLAKIAKEEKRKADKRKNIDGMFANINNAEDATGTGVNQGDDGVEGYEGAEDGLEGAKNFEGNGGVGDYGNYQLKNRKPKAKPLPIYDGGDEGVVRVKIYVDKSGKVIYAEPGVVGSTTNDLHLLKRAKEAAMKTTWDSDSKAPEKQVGYIIYNFTIEN